MTRHAAPRAALRYCLLVGIAGLVVLGVELAEGRSLPLGDATAWLLAAAVVIGELFPLTIPRRGEDEVVTVSTSFAYALLIVGGLPAAIAAQSIGVALDDLLGRKPLWRIVFNVGQYALSFAAAALVLAALGVHPGSPLRWLGASDIPAVILGAATYYLINVVLVGIGVALYQRRNVLQYMASDLGFIVMLGAFLLSLAPILIAAIDYSVALLPLMVAPFWLVHRFARQSVRVQHEATHDALTGLPNRVRFRQAVGQAIEHRGANPRFAVMLLDLDRFKEINDTLGHHYGDRLLSQTGPRLNEAVREADLIARLGGDEFAVFMRSLPAGSRTALLAAERLREALSGPFELDGFMVEVDSSIGIALYPQDGDNVDTLLQRADVAMYRAKQTGDGQLLYSTDFDHYSPARLALVADLRQAVDEGGLEVWFQPKLDLHTGLISGAEALVRWPHPTLGLLQPSAFIELAEHTGLIKPLTQRVLDLALRHRREWLEDGVDLPIAVNVSARSLHDQNFADLVARLMHMHSTTADALRIELTESSIMSEPSRAAATMVKLRNLGIQLAVDDFGTGYSSLAHLRNLPVAEIKLDKGFVIRMGTNPGDEVIVRSTIELGRSLGLRVVAEGVEDAETLRLLGELGCDEAQGFWVGHPMPATAVAAWVRRRNQAATPARRGAAVTPLKRPVGGDAGRER